ncbi:MAG: HAD-IA family hydrolase [Clostridia bacterium]|nr:HAD-IA family hydrolase [Clostridia bacterium]
MYYIFDMDGVLVNSEPVTRRAASEVLQSYGITATKEDFRPFVGAGEARFVGGVAEKYGVPYEPIMKDKLYEIYLRYVSDSLMVYPSTQLVLQELTSRGDVIALASSADFIKIEANMKTAGIPLSLFGAIVSGDDAARKKPYPDVFNAAVAKLSANPAECLVIEDALNGIQAAKAAGIPVAAVTTSFTREQLQEEKPDYIIDDLKELLTI